jgi:hypothetical protein
VEWRKLHSEELIDLYRSPNVVWGNKSRRMRWTEHVACMGDRRSAYSFMVGRPDGKRELEYLELDGRVILKWILKKWRGGHVLD